MTMHRTSRRPGFASGWILVTGLLVLCGAGTWLTVHHYKQRVFSSAHGVVLQNQWPESRIAVQLPAREAATVAAGHHALITVGNSAKGLNGEVLSVTPGAPDATVIVRLLDDAGEEGRPPAAGHPERKHHDLPPGTACSVTIDTTIPPGTPMAPQ